MRDKRHRCWLGQAIRRKRRGLLMTQGDLALLVSQLVAGTRACTQSTVSRWESGEIDVTMHYEEPLAKALGISPFDLYAPPPEGWTAPAAIKAAA